jgi:DNA-binding HxlR family transcriptional regulator
MQVNEPAAGAGGRHAPRSTCPVACSLDLLGDRWSLLVIRDLLLGKTRYGEFLASAEGIPTNILADRLKRLEQADIISSAPYGPHSRRRDYRLTPAGEALGPVIGALRDWGLSQFPGTRPHAGSAPSARLTGDRLTQRRPRGPSRARRTPSR